MGEKANAAAGTGACSCKRRWCLFLQPHTERGKNTGRKNCGAVAEHRMGNKHSCRTPKSIFSKVVHASGDLLKMFYILTDADKLQDQLTPKTNNKPACTYPKKTAPPSSWLSPRE